MRVTIDNQEIEVQAGTTVLEAASLLGISIPTMCYWKGFSSHPSCMVCMVKDLGSKKMIPSCAMPVQEGMQIQTHSPEIREVRREALELLLSDHAGDCEAPCRLSCPAFMNIPLMNRLIAQDKMYEALKIVREEISLPLILGYICPAPCEKACRRKMIDEPVSICMLKRFTAGKSEEHTKELIRQIRDNEHPVAIIGSGPAGLSAAFFLRKMGYPVTVFEGNPLPGGSLRYFIPEEKLPHKIIDIELELLSSMGILFRSGELITAKKFEEDLVSGYHAIVLACGDDDAGIVSGLKLQAGEDGKIFHPKTLMTSRHAVFGCGSIVKPVKMAVQSVAEGKHVAMEIDRFLSSRKPGKNRIRFRTAISHLLPGETEEYLKESHRGKRIRPALERIYGFSHEEAIHEAGRCLHCDCRKPVSCKLRILSEEYSANRKRYLQEERKKFTRIFRQSILVYEPEKCIKCGICVEITTRNKEEFGLTFIGRGFDLKIGVPLGFDLNRGIITTAHHCASECPTGALSVPDHEEEIEGRPDTE